MHDFVEENGYWKLEPSPGSAHAYRYHVGGESEPRLRFVAGPDVWTLSFSEKSSSIGSPNAHSLAFDDLADCHVRILRAFDDGRLEVELGDDVLLTVEPALEYEAWEIRKNGGKSGMFASPLGAGSMLNTY